MEKNRNKALLKNTFIISIGKIGTSAISFFLLPLYTKVLTPSEYGIHDLLGTLQTILGICFGLQLGNCIYRYLIVERNNTENTKKVISNVVFMNIFASLVLSVLFCVTYLILKPQYSWFLLALVLVSNLFALLQDTLRGLDKYREYALFGFVQTLILLVSNIVLVLILKKSVPGLLISSIGSQLIVSIIIFIKHRMWKLISVKIIDFNYVKQLLGYSVPLVSNELSWWVIKGSDRVIISSILGVAVNGIVSVAHKFPSVFIMFYNYFNISWTETVILHLKDEDHESYITQIVNKVMYLTFGLGFGLIAVMPFIFKIVINEQYSTAYEQIPIYMIATLFNVLVGLTSCLYIANKNTKKVAATSFMAAVVNIIINLGTIKFIGIYAASVSSMVAFCFLAVYRMHDTKRYCKIRYDKKFFIVAVVVLGAILVAYYLKNNIICLVALVIAILFFCYYNCNLILKIFGRIKK